MFFRKDPPQTEGRRHADLLIKTPPRGRARSPVIWSAAVGLVRVPDMRSAWALSWASLGMYSMACVSMNPFAVSEPAVYSVGCRRMWVLMGANAVTGSSGVPLMKVFAMDLVKIALFVECLVSNL